MEGRHSDARSFCSLEELFNFFVILVIIPQGEGMAQPRVADELLEVLGDDPAVPIRNDPRSLIRETQ